MQLAELKDNVLMAIAEQAYNNIKGINPYEKKNVFRYGKYKTNHLVTISQDYIVKKYNITYDDKPISIYHPTLNIEKLEGGATYSINFRYNGKETNKIIIKNPTIESICNAIKTIYKEIPIANYRLITNSQIFGRKAV
jgi:hypothetical protein